MLRKSIKQCFPFKEMISNNIGNVHQRTGISPERYLTVIGAFTVLTFTQDEITMLI